ncbi:hypothetical protein [Streptomyces specialis]|uniref:hypothetical protein n=1 Tax=Streptomyces specialis TaxID=498367 RepID=UPI00073E99BA|nr:hypothetical protein [Streptomyces specialis]
MRRELPGPEFWELIHPYTAEVATTQPTVRGFGSDFTAVVECEKGPFFVKAMRNRPGGRRDSILREARINPFVRPISPALLWHAEDEEWIALGFEAVQGRRPDFAPGSPDLPAVVELLDRIGEITLPDIAHDWTETRWDRFVGDEGEVELFRGDALLHMDLHPSNLIIGGRDMWAVDWAWPTRGAAFLVPASFVTQLVASGHGAEEAESWPARCRVWADADPAAIDAFAAATVRMRRAFAERRPEEQWLRAMEQAAKAWATHRGVTDA